jgi:hypothetical protein
METTFITSCGQKTIRITRSIACLSWGGESAKILANVASPITFSPDGKRFAFVRDTSETETGLFISNTDGTQEKIVGPAQGTKFLFTCRAIMVR